MCAQEYGREAHLSEDAEVLGTGGRSAYVWLARVVEGCDRVGGEWLHESWNECHRLFAARRDCHQLLLFTVTRGGMHRERRLFFDWVLWYVTEVQDQ